jgi:hypothetical protein
MLQNIELMKQHQPNTILKEKNIFKLYINENNNISNYGILK